LLINRKFLKNKFNLILSTKELDFDNLGKLNSKNGKKILSYLDNEAYLNQVKKNKLIIAVFTTKKLSKSLKSFPCIISKNPKHDFGKFHNYLVLNTDFYKKKIPWSSFIAKNSKLHSQFISNDKVRIDKGTEIESGSVIYSCVKIGKNVKISPNVVLGEDGIEISKSGTNVLRFLHDGGVIIGDDVKIQSMVSVKKGYFGNVTQIGSGTTIGSFTNIGHNVKIGKNCFIAHGSVIGGHSIIESDCFLGFNCIILQNIKIGKNCKIGANSVVTKDIPSNQVVIGSPTKFIRNNN